MAEPEKVDGGWKWPVGDATVYSTRSKAMRAEAARSQGKNRSTVTWPAKKGK